MGSKGRTTPRVVCCAIPIARAAPHPIPQTDARIASIEVKIKKLDGELARYKEQMSKLRPGPGKVRFTRLASLASILTQKGIFRTRCSSGRCSR